MINVLALEVHGMKPTKFFLFGVLSGGRGRNLNHHDERNESWAFLQAKGNTIWHLLNGDTLAAASTFLDEASLMQTSHRISSPLMQLLFFMQFQTIKQLQVPAYGLLGATVRRLT